MDFFKALNPVLISFVEVAAGIVTLVLRTVIYEVHDGCGAVVSAAMARKFVLVLWIQNFDQHERILHRSFFSGELCGQRPLFHHVVPRLSAVLWLKEGVKASAQVDVPRAPTQPVSAKFLAMSCLSTELEELSYEAARPCSRVA